MAGLFGSYYTEDIWSTTTDVWAVGETLIRIALKPDTLFPSHDQSYI